MSGKWAATNIAGCYRCAPKHFKVSLLIADDLVRLTSSSHRAAFTDKMRNTTSKFKAMVLCQVDFPLGVGWVSFCPKVKLIQLLCFPLSHWLYWLPLTSALQTSSCWLSSAQTTEQGGFLWQKHMSVVVLPSFNSINFASEIVRYFSFLQL